MQYLDNITNKIDEVLKGQLPFLSESKQVQNMGIVQLVRRQKDNKETVWPGKLVAGNYEYAGVDDDFKIITYHRVLSLKPSSVPNSGYGDSRGKNKNTVSMSFVLFADRELVAVTADVLALQIQGVLPEMLTVENFSSTLINLNDIVLNEKQVFDEEYKNVTYFIGPEHIFLKINYTIESTFQKGCFNRCDPNR